MPSKHLSCKSSSCKSSSRWANELPWSRRTVTDTYPKGCTVIWREIIIILVIVLVSDNYRAKGECQIIALIILRMSGISRAPIFELLVWTTLSDFMW
jgi:hypothetical protein